MLEGLCDIFVTTQVYLTLDDVGSLGLEPVKLLKSIHKKMREVIPSIAVTWKKRFVEVSMTPQPYCHNMLPRIKE